MSKTLDTVNQFYDLLNNQKKTEGLEALITKDMRFTGPLASVSGAEEYVGLLQSFLPAVAGWKLLGQLEDGDNVSTFYELQVNTPTGQTLTIPTAEWVQLSDGRISEQRIYYDPREFAAAFGM